MHLNPEIVIGCLVLVVAIVSSVRLILFLGLRLMTQPALRRGRAYPRLHDHEAIEMTLSWFLGFAAAGLICGTAWGSTFALVAGIPLILVGLRRFRLGSWQRTVHLSFASWALLELAAGIGALVVGIIAL